MKINLKTNKGITLIALVITIIVLLILAGITIAMLTGQNGILTNASNAKIGSIYSRAEEQVKLAYMSVKTEIMTQKVSNSSYNAQSHGSELEQIALKDLTGKSTTDNEWTKCEYSTGTHTIDITYTNSVLKKDAISAGVPKQNGEVNYQIIIDEQDARLDTNTGSDSGGEGSTPESETPTNQPPVEGSLLAMYLKALEDECDGTNCTSPTKHLHVGDYVDYKIPNEVMSDVISMDSTNYSSSGYTSKGDRNGYEDQTFSLNNYREEYWKVLGLSPSGSNVLLTTNGYLSGFYLYGAKGVALDYGITELNKICAIFKNNYAIESRSMNVDDVNRLLGITVNLSERTVKNSAGEVISENNSSYGTSRTYSNGFITPESKIEGTPIQSLNVYCDCYSYRRSDVVASEAQKEAIFGPLGGTDRFLLASGGVSLFASDGPWYGLGMVGFEKVHSADSSEYSPKYLRAQYEYLGRCGGFKPVIALRSDVLISQVPKIDGPELVGSE